MVEGKARRGASPLLNEGADRGWYSNRRDGYGRGLHAGRGHGYGSASANYFGGIHYRGDNVSAGIYRGPRGWTAYYNRHNREKYYRDCYRPYYRSDPWYWGGWYRGCYYPYGYASYYDYYYYRYPYAYVSVGYVPSWTVYVDPAETVYVESPTQTVYVESDGTAGGGYVTEDVVVEPQEGAPPDTIVPEQTTPGPYAPIEGKAEEGDTDADLPGTEGKVPVQVEPQERIPVNNALLAQAARTFKEGDYEQARRLLVQAVLSEADNGFAELAYALGHFAVGEYEAAAEAVRRGAALVPDVIDLPIDVVRQYGNASDFERHLAALRSYATGHPQDQNAWFLLGYMLYSSGRPEEAGRAFERAAKLNPSDAYAAVYRDAASRVKPKPPEEAKQEAADQSPNADAEKPEDKLAEEPIEQN
jgi:hypothetical protein